MVYVCVRDVMDVVFLFVCEAWSCMFSCMGSMRVSSNVYVRGYCGLSKIVHVLRCCGCVCCI